MQCCNGCISPYVCCEHLNPIIKRVTAWLLATVYATTALVAHALHRCEPTTPARTSLAGECDHCCCHSQLRRGTENTAPRSDSDGLPTYVNSPAQTSDAEFCVPCHLLGQMKHASSLCCVELVHTIGVDVALAMPSDEWVSAVVKALSARGPPV